MTKEWKDTKGITLITLVITIVLLLILSGVSINMITKPDGVMEQVTGTKEIADKAREKEIVETAVASSYSLSTGKLNYDVLIGKLEENGATVLGTEFPLTVYTASGYQFEIGSGGKVSIDADIKLSAKSLKLLAGGTATLVASGAGERRNNME